MQDDGIGSSCYWAVPIHTRFSDLDQNYLIEFKLFMMSVKYVCARSHTMLSLWHRREIIDLFSASTENLNDGFSSDHVPHMAVQSNCCLADVSPVYRDSGCWFFCVCSNFLLKGFCWLTQLNIVPCESVLSFVQFGMPSCPLPAIYR